MPSPKLAENLSWNSVHHFRSAADFSGSLPGVAGVAFSQGAPECKKNAQNTPYRLYGGAYRKKTPRGFE